MAPQCDSKVWSAPLHVVGELKPVTHVHTHFYHLFLNALAAAQNNVFAI